MAGTTGHGRRPAPGRPRRAAPRARRDRPVRCSLPVPRVFPDPITAEDVFQQVMTEAWPARRLLRPSIRGTLTTWKSPPTIARSRAIDEAALAAGPPRSAPRRPAGPTRAVTEDEADVLAERSLFAALLQQLPADEAELLRLRFWSELSQTEISTLTRHPARHPSRPAASAGWSACASSSNSRQRWRPRRSCAGRCSHDLGRPRPPTSSWATSTPSSASSPSDSSAPTPASAPRSRRCARSASSSLGCPRTPTTQPARRRSTCRRRSPRAPLRSPRRPAAARRDGGRDGSRCVPCSPASPRPPCSRSASAPACSSPPARTVRPPARGRPDRVLVPFDDGRPGQTARVELPTDAGGRARIRAALGSLRGGEHYELWLIDDTGRRGLAGHVPPRRQRDRPRRAPRRRRPPALRPGRHLDRTRRRRPHPLIPLGPARRHPVLTVTPGDIPSSISACLTQVRTDSIPYPSCSATRRTAPCVTPVSARSERTILTAACFSSSEYRRVVGLPAVRSWVMNSVLDSPRPGVTIHPRTFHSLLGPNVEQTSALVRGIARELNRPAGRSRNEPTAPRSQVLP